VSVPFEAEMIRWSAWQPLAGSSRNSGVPAVPGLYRVRVVETGEVVYIGQTGVSLRGRLGMLCTCYGDEMPYRDPHTAAPTLWALRHRDGVEFEASTAVIDGDKVERLALEAVAISCHRVEHGRSPLANFGGQIAGYRLSSANNAALVAAGRRFRGGPDPFTEESDGTPVLGPLDREVTASDWLGLTWSSWASSDNAVLPTGVGLYRIRRHESHDLSYVGQGRIRERIRSHLAKAAIEDHRQALHFAKPLDLSWVELNLSKRQLLEVENDAIAGHRLVAEVAPHAQFLG